MSSYEEFAFYTIGVMIVLAFYGSLQSPRANRESRLNQVEMSQSASAITEIHQRAIESTVGCVIGELVVCDSEDSSSNSNSRGSFDSDDDGDRINDSDKDKKRESSRDSSVDADCMSTTAADPALSSTDIGSSSQVQQPLPKKGRRGKVASKSGRNTSKSRLG